MLGASLLLLSAFARDASALKINAWQSKSVNPVSTDYPENSFSEVNSRPSTGIAFSGGGSRSFAATIGYLAGLNKLGLMDNVRYIAGISGGAWATSVFTYAQNVTDDAAFLGDIVNPENIVYDDLKVVSDNGMRRLTQNDLTVVALKAIKDKVVSSLPDAWCYGVQKAYLEPVGITASTRFSWSDATVQDIKSRNPELKNERFLLPTNKQRPFMILGSTLVGPNEGSPYHSEDHNFTMIEFTSLYAGQMHKLAVEYHNPGLIHTDHINKPYKRTVGGLIENYAFTRDSADGSIAPSRGLAPGSTQGVLTVPAVSNFLDLQFAAGAAGYAPGAFFESSYVPTVADKAGMHFTYWSPTETASPLASDTLFTDGGCYENDALLPLLQRQVKKIVLFINPSTALQPASSWNVETDAPDNSHIDSSVSSFFGQEAEDNKEVVDRNFMYGKNQVFSKDDYTRVIKALQAAQAQGSGIIVSLNLTTVENQWWGIPAGFTSEITFVYLGRLSQWESRLSADMQARVIPTDGNPSDLSNTIDSGIFRHFPHYLTAGGLLTAQQTNLLADLTGWSVLQNKELFEHIFA